MKTAYALVVAEEVPYEAAWETCIGIFESEDAAMMARAWLVVCGKFLESDINSDALWAIRPIEINSEVTMHFEWMQK